MDRPQRWKVIIFSQVGDFPTHAFVPRSIRFDSTTAAALTCFDLPLYLEDHNKTHQYWYAILEWHKFEICLLPKQSKRQKWLQNDTENEKQSELVQIHGCRNATAAEMYIFFGRVDQDNCTGEKLNNGSFLPYFANGKSN